MEEIRDEVRNWYLTYKQQTGKFPTIPSEDHGGSRVVIGRQSPLPGSSEGSHSTVAASVESNEPSLAKLFKNIALNLLQLQSYKKSIYFFRKPFDAQDHLFCQRNT